MPNPISLDEISSYKAAQAIDGTWTIFDVEIFAAFSDTEREVIYDRPFLESIIQRHRSRCQEGYLAPMHSNHHGKGQSTPRVGAFLPRRVGETIYEGKPLDVLFADLIGVPDAAYQDMRNGSYPARSVEIDPSEPEILSLALLSDDVPYLRFPILVPREVTATVGNGDQLVYCYGLGVTMPDDKKDEEEKPDKFEDDEKAEKFGEDEEPEKFEDGSNPLEAIIGSLGQAAAAIQQAAEQLQGFGQPEAVQPQTGPVEMSHRGRNDRDASYHAGATQALRDEVNQLRSKWVKYERKQAMTQAITNAETELRKKGVTVSHDKLVSYAAKGSAYLDGYLQSIKEHSAPQIPQPWTGEIYSKTTGDLPAVASYGNKSPQTLSEARKVSAVYDHMGHASPKMKRALDAITAKNAKTRSDDKYDARTSFLGYNVKPSNRIFGGE